jgi:hypothetical protein
MEKKQTAVEWLIEAIESQKITIVYSDKVLSVSVPIAIADQAKQMEKEQSVEFWQGGINCTEEGGKSFEQYYNETYGKD